MKVIGKKTIQLFVVAAETNAAAMAAALPALSTAPSLEIFDGQNLSRFRGSNFKVRDHENEF